LRRGLNWLKEQKCPLHCDVFDSKLDVKTDESKALVKKIGISAVLLFVVLSILRALVPWAILAIAAYSAYKWLSKNS